MEWRAYHRIMHGNVKLFWIFLRLASQWDIFGRKAHGFHTVKNGAFVYVACNKFCDLGWQRLDRKSFKMRSKLESCDFGVPKRCLLTKINGDFGDVPWIFFGGLISISPWKLHWFLEETQQDLGGRWPVQASFLSPKLPTVTVTVEWFWTSSNYVRTMCIHVYTVVHLSSHSIIDHWISRRSKKYPSSLTSQAWCCNFSELLVVTSEAPHATHPKPLGHQAQQV